MSAPAGRHVLVGVVILVVLAVIVAALVVLGPPSEERARKLDARRVSDLHGVETAVIFHRRKYERMPSSLDELVRDSSVKISNDPVTGTPYSYRALQGDNFEVCGTFDRASARDAGSVDEWQHPAGRHCFSLKVQ